VIAGTRLLARNRPHNEAHILAIAMSTFFTDFRTGSAQSMHSQASFFSDTESILDENILENSTFGSMDMSDSRRESYADEWEFGKDLEINRLSTASTNPFEQQNQSNNPFLNGQAAQYGQQSVYDAHTQSGASTPTQNFFDMPYESSTTYNLHAGVPTPTQTPSSCKFPFKISASSNILIWMQSLLIIEWSFLRPKHLQSHRLLTQERNGCRTQLLQIN
jgi:hypothetical protein